MMRHLAVLLSAAAALALSGCSSPGLGDADLVVCNDNPQVIYTVTLTTELQSESLSAPRDVGLLERGEWCGFTLEDGTRTFTLELMGEHGDLLARCRGSYEGTPLLLTFGQDGQVSVQEEET